MVRKRGSLGFCFSSNYFYAYLSPFYSCVSFSCGILSAIEMVSCLGQKPFVTYWYTAKESRTQFLMGFISFCCFIYLFFYTDLWFWVMVHWLTHFVPLHCLIRQSVRRWVMQTHHIHVGKGSCCTVALKWPLGGLQNRCLATWLGVQIVTNCKASLWWLHLVCSQPFSQFCHSLEIF